MPTAAHVVAALHGPSREELPLLQRCWWHKPAGRCGFAQSRVVAAAKVMVARPSWGLNLAEASFGMTPVCLA
jgi:aerobic-type carbon monoxide dehydrogenase small subunit (CoxS/CutS family)